VNAIALRGLDPPRLALAEPVLVARGLTRHYGKTRALDGVDVEVLPGEILGIVGESGSGKSTLMRILNLEEAPDAGSYALQLEDGGPRSPVLGLARFERRMLRARHIGIVYQNPHVGLRMRHSSSGNVAERLLVAGERSVAALRARAGSALESSEFPMDRFDARA
jgi:putative phosphonate transport system ATP-binding protein